MENLKTDFYLVHPEPARAFAFRPRRVRMLPYIMKNIHGHEVLNRMLASGKVYTRQGLIDDIIDTFGSGARFHTCSAEGLTAEELVDFLKSRGKFIERGGGFQTSPDLLCGR